MTKNLKATADKPRPEGARKDAKNEKEKNRALHAVLNAFAGLLRLLGFGELRPIARSVQAASLWLTLGAVSALFLWSGYHFGDRNGLLIGFFSAVGLNALVFLFSDWLLSRQFQGTTIEGRDAWGLRSYTGQLAKRLAQAPPHLIEVKSDTPYVLSAGLFADRLRIFYSSALLKRFSRQEIEALLAFEIYRFHSGQTRVLTAAVALADLLLLVASGFDAIFVPRVLMKTRPRRASRGPFTILFSPFIAVFLRLVSRRQSAQNIDADVAKFLGESETLARTFSKLDAYSKTLPLDVNLAEAALFPIYPLLNGRWSRWLAVQPLLEPRLRALTGRYPL